MKRFFSLSALMGLAMTASAQFNLQLHYDLGRHINPESEANRKWMTVTAEFFKADKLGYTFLFIDMDYKGKRPEYLSNTIGEDKWGATSAYWEIGRDFTFAKVKNTNSDFSAHIEYDGGLSNYMSFQHSMLVGPAWNWHSNNFNRTFTLQMLYKQIFCNATFNSLPSFQTTAVWGINFAKGLCTFSGYADLWYGYTPSFEKGLIFLSESQFWFNIFGKERQNNKLSVGTELKLTNNFIWPFNDATRTFYFDPTLAVKYTF